MKVRVTFDVTEEQRLAVGLITHGKFKLMSHEELVHWIEVSMATRLNTITEAYEEVRDDLLVKLADADV